MFLDLGDGNYNYIASLAPANNIANRNKTTPSYSTSLGKLLNHLAAAQSACRSRSAHLSAVHSLAYLHDHLRKPALSTMSLRNKFTRFKHGAKHRLGMGSRNSLPGASQPSQSPVPPMASHAET